MSPTQTSQEESFLEHPNEAFTFYRNCGVDTLICEEKHMGSRVIVIVCKNNEAARKRFGIAGDEIGICYTRTGRRFFDNPGTEEAFLSRVSQAVSRAGLWEEWSTDWFCFDAELMPWSAKAMALLEQQYAPVGASACAALSQATTFLGKSAGKVEGIEALHHKFQARAEMAALYRAAYRRYCWTVNGIEDYKLAPFHVLASEGSFNMDKNHLWHMDIIDRPYVASSLMSVAVKKVFGTALSGKSKQRQELVERPLPLEIMVCVLPCRGGENLLHRLFEPLGYEVDTICHRLDETFPEWGESPYFTVTLKRTCPVREFLTHLYVLIPVLDNDKHYWIGDDEIEKLLRFGDGWLAAHPDKDLITRRYLKNFKSLATQALERLCEDQPLEETNDTRENAAPREHSLEKTINLNQERIEWVSATLKAHGAKRVIDLGCGEGKLLKQLLQDMSFEQITGADVSSRALEIAKDHLNSEQLPSIQRKRLHLMQTALTYRDKRLTGYDAATLMEVIEHMDLPRLDAFKRVVFEFAKPSLVIVTTPNAEYNVLFETLPAGQFRHNDHRFEWTRAEFQDWAHRIARQFGYTVTFEGIGHTHETLGAPTQGGVFTRND